MPTSRINPGKRGVRAEPSTLDTTHKLFPQPGNGYPQAKKDPIVLTGTINNPFRTTKATTNGNHRLCLRLKTQVKCHRSFAAG